MGCAMGLAWLSWLSEGLLVLVCEGLEAVAGRLALCSEAVLGVLAASELLSELGVGTCSSWVLLVGACGSLEVVVVVACDVAHLRLIVDQADRVLDQMALA